MDPKELKDKEMSEAKKMSKGLVCLNFHIVLVRLTGYLVTVRLNSVTGSNFPYCQPLTSPVVLVLILNKIDVAFILMLNKLDIVLTLMLNKLDIILII